jgi:hypothetical protein
MKQLLILLFVALSFNVSAQSAFKRYPKPTHAKLTYLNNRGITSANVNPEVIALRFSAPTATYLYPQRMIGTSLGIGYNRMHWVDSLQKYYKDFALNLAIIAAGNTTPNVNNFMSIGIFACFYNSLFQFGPVYTLPSATIPKGTFGVGVNIGVPF